VIEELDKAADPAQTGIALAGRIIRTSKSYVRESTSSPLVRSVISRRSCRRRGWCREPELK
jgi:hypothetical protein